MAREVGLALGTVDAVGLAVGDAVATAAGADSDEPADALEPGLGLAVAGSLLRTQAQPTAPSTTAANTIPPSTSEPSLDIVGSVRAGRPGHDWPMAPTAPILSAAQRSFLTSTRRAVLATITPDGRPRLVPICFVVAEDAAVVYTPIDDKPKQTGDPLALARVRDIISDPRVSVIVDRWHEDWRRLAWLRVDGRAGLIVPDDPVSADEHGSAVTALRDRYPQYAEHRLGVRPVIRIAVERVVAWGATDD